MNSLQWITLIALAEATLLLSLLLVFGAVMLKRRSRQEAAAAATLATRVSENAPQRQAELHAYLKRELMLDEPELQQQVEKIMTLETRFYSELHRIWCERDSHALQNLDQQLNAVLTPYLDLRLKSSPDASAEAAAEIDNLKTSLNQSTEELALYRDTLNTVFNEYTAMFGSRTTSTEPLTAEEIIKRLKEGPPDAASK